MRRTSFYTETCYREGEGEGTERGFNRFCHFPSVFFVVLPSENYDVDEAHNISRKQWRRARTTGTTLTVGDQERASRPLRHL